LIIRRLIAPLAVAFVTLHAGQAAAQDASQAPLPNQPAPPPANASPFPQGGAAPPYGSGLGAPPSASGPSEACMKDFAPLREEAEKRGKLIKAASDSKAPPDEACKLIVNFGDAEIKMIKYVDANAAKCGIPPQIADQLKAGHQNTDALLQKVCRVAQQLQRSPQDPARINDIGDPVMERLFAPR
jgi:hypothetical protein